MPEAGLLSVPWSFSPEALAGFGAVLVVGASIIRGEAVAGCSAVETGGIAVGGVRVLVVYRATQGTRRQGNEPGMRRNICEVNQRMRKWNKLVVVDLWNIL